MIEQILLTTLISVLLMLVEHWFPWRLLLRKDLPRVAAYVLGVLGMAVSLTGLYAYWAVEPPDPFWAHGHLAALWSVIVGSGLAVVGAYGIDRLLTRLARSVELEEILEIHRNAQDDEA